MSPRQTARALIACAALVPVLLDGRQAALNGVPLQMPTGTGLILGRVVDAADGKPIARALVTINGPGRIDEKDNPILTDAQGRFLFANLPAGQFAFRASADGYWPGDTFFGRRIALLPDQKLGDVTIALARTAAITGTVTDTRGEPLVGAVVHVLRQPASSALSTRGVGFINDATRTDDLGAYRVANLPAGDYVVVVPSSATTVPVAVVDAGQAARAAGEAASFGFTSELFRSNAPVPSTSGRRMNDAYVQTSLPAYDTRTGLVVRPTTYFDGAATAGMATVIRVKAGDERGGVDIRVPAVRGFVVAGRVDVPGGSPAHLGVSLLPAEWAASRKNGAYEPYLGDTEIAKTVTTADGAFRFLAVPPGDYVIRLLRPSGPGGVGRPPSLGPISDADVARLEQQPTLYALQPVSVGADDVTDVSLSVRAGPRISGRVEFNGSAQRPLPEQGAAPEGRMRLAVRLEAPPGVGIPTGVRPAPVGADGRFTTMSLPPGRYFISAEGLGPGWRLASAMVNSRDVSRLPLDLEGDLPDLLLTVVDNASGRVAGTVRSAQTLADADTTVYALPADYQALLDAGSGALSRALRQARPDARGTYNFMLTPGTYVVVAVQSGGQIETAAAINRVAAQGARVTIGKGTTQTLDLVPMTVDLP